MATVDWKVLAEGAVSNVQGTIFTAAEQTLVKSAMFVNTNAADQDLKVYVKKAAGTARLQAWADAMPQGYSKEAAGQGIYLEAGDTLEAVSTTDTAVTFSLFGGERVP